MAQKNRSKELWLIPKRGSLHQTICLIDGIIERGYDGTSWNDSKQNNLGVNLKNWGATKDGKNISSQAIRTLAASIPQYLGFLYINTNTTPNSICITDAGKKLLNTHKKELTKVKNLIEGDKSLIKQSDVVLHQMEKLQITNPIILKDCENILVFPFRMTLKLLLELDYLDREELAYFIFKIKDETEFELTLTEIRNFRQLPIDKRSEIINAYKKTHIGNITLAQASSASYYEGLCRSTGIIERIVVKPKNKSKKIQAIRIKDGYLEYAREVVLSKYLDSFTYDFADNLELWIEYFGNTERLTPPVDIEIENKAGKTLLVQIKKDEKIKNVDLIENMGIIKYPMFINEDYEIVLIDVDSGAEISTETFTPKNRVRGLTISGKLDTKSIPKTAQELSEMILKHSNCTTFCGEMLNYLTVLKKVIGIDKTEDKSLRGAYYEYLFYQLLEKLKTDGTIDDVVWNGKIGKYGLPTQAPGGKTGTTDIVFVVGKKHYVLELTTIKSKSGQEKAEIASVPDHIRLYKEKYGKDVIGIFCAPIIHERNTEIMKSVLKKYDIKLECVTDAELISKLLAGEL